MRPRRARPTEMRRDEHGHQDEIPSAGDAECRQPRRDPRAGRATNNLKDVSIELPKRRLTVFTGVSGSGKSSLVFATIAAESAADDQRDLQRLLAGLHADAGPARTLNLLEGLTDGTSSLDQEADGRQLPGPPWAPSPTQNAMLRIVFSRLGQPHVGSPAGAFRSM